MVFFDHQFAKADVEKKVSSMGKTYVECIVRFDCDGIMKPLKIKFHNELYEIDRVTLVNEARCGADLKYRVNILGKITNLFFEAGRWWVMEK